MQITLLIFQYRKAMVSLRIYILILYHKFPFMQALYTAILPQGRVIFTELRCGVLRGVLVFCVNLFAVSHCRRAPRGNFLCEQKVTKESFRRRGLRFPRLLKTSTLEPPKRNRARFPFDSLHGKAKLQQTSAVFFALSQFFAREIYRQC